MPLTDSFSCGFLAIPWVLRRVKDILARHAEGLYSQPDHIPDVAPVFGFDGVVIDSLEVLDALCEIEAEFCIAIPDEDLREELFKSVGVLAAYVAWRAANPGTAEGVPWPRLLNSGSP